MHASWHSCSEFTLIERSACGFDKRFPDIKR
jgi:hypothetical protein